MRSTRRAHSSLARPLLKRRSVSRSERDQRLAYVERGPSKERDRVLDHARDGPGRSTACWHAQMRAIRDSALPIRFELLNRTRFLPLPFKDQILAATGSP